MPSAGAGAVLSGGGADNELRRRKLEQSSSGGKCQIHRRAKYMLRGSAVDDAHAHADQRPFADSDAYAYLHADSFQRDGRD
jgi:hypothetical protein